jgi:hypothetical protein
MVETTTGQVYSVTHRIVAARFWTNTNHYNH